MFTSRTSVPVLTPWGPNGLEPRWWDSLQTELVWDEQKASRFCLEDYTCALRQPWWGRLNVPDKPHQYLCSLWAFQNATWQCHPIPPTHCCPLCSAWLSVSATLCLLTFSGFLYSASLCLSLLLPISHPICVFFSKSAHFSFQLFLSPSAFETTFLFS